MRSTRQEHAQTHIQSTRDCSCECQLVQRFFCLYRPQFTNVHHLIGHAEYCTVQNEYLKGVSACINPLPMLYTLSALEIGQYKLTAIRPVFSGTVPFLRGLSRNFFKHQTGCRFVPFFMTRPVSVPISRFWRNIICDSSMIKQVHQSSTNCMQNFNNFSGVSPPNLRNREGLTPSGIHHPVIDYQKYCHLIYTSWMLFCCINEALLPVYRDKVVQKVSIHTYHLNLVN